MAIATKLSRFDRVRQLLEESAGGEASAFAGLALWFLPHDQWSVARLLGLPLLEVKAAAHCCCKTAPAADASGSALLRGLHGQQPFDGSQFPRLPWGRPAIGVVIRNPYLAPAKLDRPSVGTNAVPKYIAVERSQDDKPESR